MYEPGYYKTNHRALSLREMIRMRGPLRLPFTYYVTRRMKANPAVWMPQMWANLVCTEQELSARFIQVAEPYRQTFRSLGFQETGFKKLKGILNPHHRDDGGINFLDSSRCHFGQLIYNKSRVPAPVNQDREQVVVAFTAVFEKGTVSYTNNTKTAFDTVPNHDVTRIQSNDVGEIYQRFVNDLVKRGKQARHFPDQKSLQSWFDSNATEVFNHRVRKGLFVRMTDAEVAIARKKVAPPVPRG